MTRWCPRLRAVMAERGLDDAGLAALARVDARDLDAALHGRPLPARKRQRVVKALLALDPDDAVLAGALSAVAQGFPYATTDPHALRAVEHALRAVKEAAR